MQRVAIYIEDGSDPSRLRDVFNEVRVGLGRIVTLVQEASAGARPVLTNLTSRLEAGEFDRIATLSVPHEGSASAPQISPVVEGA